MSKIFKVGDRVRLRYLLPHYGRDSRKNPLWGGRYGKIAGTVKEISDHEICPILVSWDNGAKNSYYKRHLELHQNEKREKVIMREFKVGDRVRLWHKGSDKIIGTVKEINNDEDFPIFVRWDSSEVRSYKSDALKLHKRGNNMIEKAKTMADGMREYIKPYEKYIGFVAMAFLIDHFLLKGKFAHKFKDLGEALVKKASKILDNFTDKINNSMDKALDLDTDDVEGEE
jgi:hypothetical protein